MGVQFKKPSMGGVCNSGTTQHSLQSLVIIELPNCHYCCYYLVHVRGFVNCEASVQEKEVCLYGL